jgi:hypothetical protein
MGVSVALHNKRLMPKPVNDLEFQRICFDELREMVLLGRIELPTSSLPMTRSTTELQQHTPKGGPMRRLRIIVKRLASAPAIWHRPVMAKDMADKERIKAERLREALRANLRRRKAKPDPVQHDKSPTPPND